MDLADCMVVWGTNRTATVAKMAKITVFSADQGPGSRRFHNCLALLVVCFGYASQPVPIKREFLHVSLIFNVYVVNVAAVRPCTNHLAWESRRFPARSPRHLGKEILNPPRHAVLNCDIWRGI